MSNKDLKEINKNIALIRKLHLQQLVASSLFMDYILATLPSYHHTSFTKRCWDLLGLPQSLSLLRLNSRPMIIQNFSDFTLVHQYFILNHH